MGIEIQQNHDQCRIIIDDELTIYTAAEMKENLLKALYTCRQMEVSLAGVSEIDSAGVQIILLLHREAKRLEKELFFINHSPAVVEVLELLNLVSYLGDPVVIPAKEV